jgi:hypothetical protein
MSATFAFAATLWEYDGEAAWHFVSLPEDLADEIAERSAGRTRGFGSVRVEVAIGASRWHTSLFPDSRRGTYVLPVKRAVRVAEQLADGSCADVHLRLLDAGGADT